MGIFYNKPSLKDKRNYLRKNPTLTEALLWRFLKNRQMKGLKFRRQYSVGNFIIDFYCPELKIAVEIDGDIHDEPEQKQYDINRQKYIEQFAIKFIRIKNEELFGNPNKAFDKIEDFIEKHWK